MLIQKNVVISQACLASDDDYDVIYSNIHFVNALLERYVEYAEICPSALQSYFVDFYLAQVNNGGFSQFVYNSGWDEFMVNQVESGLLAMGAKEHHALLQKAIQIVNQMDEETFMGFVEGHYFGDDANIQYLNQFDDAFYALKDSEDLVDLNVAFLKNQADLQALSDSAWQAKLDELASLVPDVKAREEKAWEAAPDYLKQVLVLCEANDMTLDRITAGDPEQQVDGESVLAWHFLSDKGHFFMVEGDGEVVLYDDNAQEILRAPWASAQ